MKVLFTYHYGDEKMKAIEDLGYEVIYQHEGSLQVRPELLDAQVLVCYNPFSRIDLADFPKLKWIQLSSIGIDQVPKEDLLKRDIMLTNNRGGYSIPMGEWIVMKLLEAAKEAHKFYEQQAKHKWKMNTGITELKGKRVLFLGAGTIPQEAAKRLQGFDMDLIAMNHSGRAAEFFHQTIATDDLKEVLASADYVVCALPSTPETHHFIDEAFLDQMKEGASLINVARGDLIDEAALVQKASRLHQIHLDVTTIEPLPADDPLWQVDNIFITPHNSWVSEMRNERRYQLIYENLKRFKEGAPLQNIVSIERGY